MPQSPSVVETVLEAAVSSWMISCAAYGHLQPVSDCLFMEDILPRMRPPAGGTWRSQRVSLGGHLWSPVRSSGHLLGTVQPRQYPRVRRGGGPQEDCQKRDVPSSIIWQPWITSVSYRQWHLWHNQRTEETRLSIHQHPNDSHSMVYYCFVSFMRTPQHTSWGLGRGRAGWGEGMSVSRGWERRGLAGKSGGREGQR